jgi:CRP-like cAMP-binding protein
MNESMNELRQTAMISGLRQCRMFTGLPAEHIQAIAGFTVCKSLSKGEYLFHEGEASQGFYIVQRGAINVHRVNANGKEQVIHIFRPGDSFAEASLATDRGYPADARAEATSQVLLVQKAGFVELFRRHPEVALRLLAAMAHHLNQVVGQLEDLTLKDVESRLANWLLKQCPDRALTDAVVTQLPVTKRVLAAELGTVSETLSRTMAKFREQGLLEVDGGRLTIVNPARLTEVLRRNLGE